MKLDRFTKICINIVLILVIALLLKFFIAVPKEIYARSGVEYKVTNFDFEIVKLVEEWGEEKFEKIRKEKTEAKLRSFAHELILNRYAKKGWRLHSNIVIEGSHLAIFER